MYLGGRFIFVCLDKNNVYEKSLFLFIPTIPNKTYKTRVGWNISIQINAVPII